MNTPTSGAADLPEALLNIAREIEALKRECGMDPESPVAIQNGRYMALSYKVRALAAQAISAETAGAAQPISILVSELRKHRFCGDCYPENGWPGVNDALAQYELWKRASHGQAPAQPDSAEGDVFRALIEFLVHADDALAFLRCWNEGNFGTCRLEWPEAPPYLYPDTAPTPTPQAADTGAAPAQGAGITAVGGADEWRRLALQFDGHRMQAIGLLKLIDHTLKGGTAFALEKIPGDIAAFLAAPPLSGDEILAERITALTAPQQAPTAASQQAPVRQIEVCPELNLSNYADVDVDRLNDWAIRADAEIDRLAVSLPPADSVLEDAARWFTVVYHGISTSDEARALGEHPKASAMSWSHAIRERDAARAAQKEGETL